MQRSPPSLITWIFSSWATAGADTKASWCPPIHPLCGRAPGGMRPALRCAFTSASRTWMTCLPISSAVSRACARRRKGAGESQSVIPQTESASASGELDPTDPVGVRRAIRAGRFSGFTNTVAHGYVQGNLVIVPERYAADFADYCRNNPRPCPLLGMSDPGSPRIPALADDMDLRTDVGEYRVFRAGMVTGITTDIRDLWRSDFVAFVLGCSFSFEQELTKAGVRVSHIESGSVSPMYVTSVDTVAAGEFQGK